ncbi:Battrachocottus baikalensis orf1 and orf2 genes [Elysia marginata]|uniref:Battrachocottus baikalensis orf1 and orf2 genes n=1 Tax=Elysia marginata TaxID=1093978 RepID=A0AAV4H5E8_9GAST|nr:Battrachocottus baikalensis orf1 and orf2 genes [Elysia marginata]
MHVLSTSCQKLVSRAYVGNDALGKTHLAATIAVFTVVLVVVVVVVVVVVEAVVVVRAVVVVVVVVVVVLVYDVVKTNTGAPQECVLSPVLFTSYTNDCRSSREDVVPLLKFADATTLQGLINANDETAYRS